MAAAMLRRSLIILAVGCAAGWMLLALGTQYVRNYTLARETAQLEQRRHELVVQNNALREEIQRLLTDDRYIERLAREQLGLVRPGEVELVIVSPAPAHSPAAAPHTTSNRAAPREADTRGTARPPMTPPALVRLIVRLWAALEHTLSRLRP